MADERGELLAFLSVFVAVMARQEGTEPEQIPAETPLAGLRMAAGDMLEMSAGMTSADLADIEGHLAAAGAPSLAEIRRRLSKKLAAILKRGVIQSEAEYYLVRGFAVETDPQSEGTALWDLISAYEGT